MTGRFNIITHYPLTSVVTEWAQRVKRNGGATPGQQTLTAMDRFYKGIIVNNFSSSIKALNVFAPDNLIACQTPLFVGGSFGGRDPWQNVNFASGDLTVNGLQGAANKYMNVGITCSLAWVGAATASAGMTLYVTSASNGNENDMGIWAASGALFGAYVGYAGTAYWDCWNVSTGRISTGNSLWNGFISFNRSAVNMTRIHRAKSTLNFSTLVQGTGTTTGTIPTTGIQIFKQNNSATGCTKRFSFGAVHNGFDSGSCQRFYNLVQQLRIDLGGGWV